MRTFFRYLIASMILMVMPATPTFAAPEEPDGYRQKAYRSAVPATLKGAEVVTTSQAHRLWQDKAAIFIDVLPAPPRPGQLPEETLWQEPKRLNIPGSTWLANVGFGRLHPTMHKYFRSNLQKLTHGDKSAAVVIYCQAVCWMSWNAAKRALEYGYENVIWYPDGTTGWSAQNLPMEQNSPHR